MKRLFLIAFFIITVTACASTQETLQPAFTTIALTVTQELTQTPEPSPTPAPEPYLLEDGVLRDWDEMAGEYVVVSEGIGDITTTAEGEIVALDSDGFPRFVFRDGIWREIKIPEGAENYVEYVVPDRYVTRVNDEGQVEEVLQTGLVVLKDPDTGVWKYQKNSDGSWGLRNPEVQIVGETISEKTPHIEVPKEVVESAVEIVRNSEKFHRIVDGEKVEVKTGLTEAIIEPSSDSSVVYARLSAVLVGSMEYSTGAEDFLNNSMVAFMAVELKSGDVLILTFLFDRDISGDYSHGSIEFESGIMPNDKSDYVTLDTKGQVIPYNAISNLLLSTPVGEPFYLTPTIHQGGPMDEMFGAEWTEVRNALESGDNISGNGNSYWFNGSLGAKDTFWKQLDS